MATSSSSILRIFFAALVAAILLAVSQGTDSVSADATEYADGTGTCAGLMPCNTGADAIQDAVDAVDAGGTVNVFPGTYVKGADVTLAKGGLTLVTVDASGSPTPGTVTINATGGGPTGVAIYGCDVPGDIIIDGFTVSSETREPIFLCDFSDSFDVTIKNVTANNAEFNHGVVVSMDGGNIVVLDSTANGNDDDGFELVAGGDVTVTGSTANGNDDDGFNVVTSGSITITNSTANDNDDEGFELDSEQNISIDGVTALNNGDDGIDLEEFEEEGQNIAVVDSRLQDNSGAGLDIDKEFHSTSATYLANGNIICGNVEAGLEQNSAVTTDATANWWGDASGPTHPSNAGGSGDVVVDAANGAAGEDPGLGTADFDPWIDTVSGSADAATISQPSAVSFQFTDTSVALTDGPGDPNGAPTFSAATDNGAVSTSGFISGGKLEVTLTPATGGSATVTVTGPCGLEGSITLDVPAAPVAATPTVAAAVQLPTTGGTPSDGGSGALPWLAAIAGAIALIGSGSAWLAYQRRRVR